MASERERARRERRLRAAEAARAAANDFPFPRFEAPGAEALERWTALKAEGRGWPVVVGGDMDFARVAEQIRSGDDAGAILARADALEWPDAIRRLRSKEQAELAAYLAADALRRSRSLGARIGALFGFGASAPTVSVEAMAEGDLADVGDWPEAAPAATGLTVAEDWDASGLDGRAPPYEVVHIVLLPTTDSAEALAHLRWGGWNDCPAPEYQVAALRSWRDRYGIDLVGASADVLNLRAARRPQTRDEALDLAREHFWHCNDSIYQSAGTLSVLAAGLLADDWWRFWWD